VWIALKTVQIKHNVLIRKSRVNCIYVKKSSYYIHGPLGDENIFAVLHVTLLWALHIVIKQQFFYIYICSFSTKFTLHVYFLLNAVGHFYGQAVNSSG